jgi:hypothetical protein
LTTVADGSPARCAAWFNPGDLSLASQLRRREVIHRAIAGDFSFHSRRSGIVSLEPVALNRIEEQMRKG